MHALDILGEPVRRRVLELLADGERSAGTIVGLVGEEFGISQPAVSQHLKVLRESGFVAVRVDGARRMYSIDPAPLRAVDEWIDPFRRFWAPRLDALGTEIARGKRNRRTASTPSTTTPPSATPSATKPPATTPPDNKEKS